MTYAAAALCRARQWQQSLALLSTVPECRAQLGSTLVAFSAGVLWANALLLLRSSRRSRSSEPDAGAVAAVLGACGAARRWEQCLELLEEMCDRRVEMNLACYTEAAYAHLKAHQDFRGRLTLPGLPGARTRHSAVQG